MANCFLTKRIGISALHELRSPNLSDEENLKVFGKCFRTHGHDYWIEATIKGKIDSSSGLICDRDYFDNKLVSFAEKYNKTNLNHFFKSTTGEDLAREFFVILEKELKPLALVWLRLQETPKNFFTFGNREIFADPTLLS